MSHWRTKILFSLILYCGGFLTAVYVLAPSTASAAADNRAQTAGVGDLDAQAWAVKLRGGIEKAVSFAEDNALRVAELIRSKMEQSEK